MENSPKSSSEQKTVNHEGETDATRKRSKSKSRKKSKKRRSKETDNKNNDSQEKRPSKRSRCSILNGMVLSVSTLVDRSNGKVDSELSYNEVCQSCRELGAEIMSQVCKRVQGLVCTKSAVSKTTQRVRKAFKKGIPIIDIAWVQKCKEEKKRVSYESFLLDSDAEEAINARENATTDDQVADEVDPNAGWSEAVALGCCCVCHENGAEKDCKWCTDSCKGS